MKIQVGENWLITSDPMNVILQQRYEKQKEGKPSGEFDWKNIAYCKDLSQACDKMLERELNIADAENLAEIACIIHRAKTDILAAVAGETDSRIQDLHEEKRKLNATINKVKALSVRCDNEGRPVETWEIFEILNPEEAAAK